MGWFHLLVFYIRKEDFSIIIPNVACRATRSKCWTDKLQVRAGNSHRCGGSIKRIRMLHYQYRHQISRMFQKS